MIWTRGEIVPDEALSVSVLDRTFEHGLGLFETFRTWNGHATLLDRHLDRLQRSAGALGLAVDPDLLPDAAAVRRLRDGYVAAPVRSGEGEPPCEPDSQQARTEPNPPDAPGPPPARTEPRPPGAPAGSKDVRLRIVVSGGVLEAPGVGEPSTVWMTVGPLPRPIHRGARVLRLILVDPQDPLARHKTLNYWRRRIEQDRAAAEGADEVLCVTPDGLICEGTRANLFLVADDRLVTPSPDGPLLPGVMRQAVIEHARLVGIPVVEGPVGLGAIDSAAEAFLTNSVRGMLPVARLLHAELPAPGPVTRQLWDRIRPWLESGGATP